MKKEVSKLGNPVAIVAGAKVVEKSAEAIPFLIKSIFILTVGYFGYKAYKNGFTKKKENNNWAPANVTYAQAKSRADAIDGAKGFLTNNFSVVSSQITGLNYNGFVRVYNAFGHRKRTYLGGDMNLEEWIHDQFSAYEVKQLSFLLGGAFFQ